MTDAKKIIDEKTVEKTAQLARLRLNPDDCRQMQHELEQILEHFACLENIDTQGIKPAYHPFNQENHMREDASVLSDRQEDWLNLAGKQKDGYLVVPRTVED